MSMQLMDDNRLVKLYVKGNEDALAMLVSRHKQRVYSHIYLLVRNRELTEDFFQDTFFKVIQSLKSGHYYEDGKFLAWVLRIAHNLVIDHFRKAKKMPQVPNVINEEGEEVDIFSILKIDDDSRPIEERQHIKKIIRQLIEELPYEQKEVLIMRTYYDMSFKEIAEVTNSSINTSLGRMRYALLNIKKMMEDKRVEIAI
ncbi:MAG TPA: sigma-70 family RNA polymerase sigma factor [Bacteroidia bacterium]|jgi:RNA polymerase sigma factor (sigma-70 family)|nr:sigma-70 family RNA polymerase sigma factor [Bacteroidia bacterium]